MSAGSALAFRQMLRRSKPVSTQLSSEMTCAKPLAAHDVLLLVALDRFSDTTLVLLESDFVRVWRSVVAYKPIDLFGISAR